MSSPDTAPSPFLATVGNALSQAARPAILLASGVGYGPAVVGQLAAAFSLSVLATVAFYPALGFAVLRHRADFHLTAGLVRRMLAILLASTTLFGVLLLADQLTVGWTSRILPTPTWVLWVWILAPLTVAEQYALGLCSVGGLLDTYSLAMLGSRIGLLIGAAVLIFLHAPPVALLVLFALGSFGLLVRVAFAIGRPPPGAAPVGLRRDGLAAAPNAWAWFLMAQASILVIQFLQGDRASGVFAIAYLLLNLPVLALQGIAMAWTATASRRGPAQEWVRTRRLIPSLVLLHFVIVLALALAGVRWWSGLFGDNGLAPAFPVLLRMCIGAPGFALAYLFMPQWVSRGWFIRLSALYMVLALAYLGALAWAAERGSLLDLGWCTAGLGLALMVVNLWAARHWGSREEAMPIGTT
jgi:hypothetical protein